MDSLSSQGITNDDILEFFHRRLISRFESPDVLRDKFLTKSTSRFNVPRPVVLFSGKSLARKHSSGEGHLSSFCATSCFRAVSDRDEGRLSGKDESPQISTHPVSRYNHVSTIISPILVSDFYVPTCSQTNKNEFDKIRTNQLTVVQI